MGLSSHPDPRDLHRFLQAGETVEATTPVVWLEVEAESRVMTGKVGVGEAILVATDRRFILHRPRRMSLGSIPFAAVKSATLHRRMLTWYLLLETNPPVTLRGERRALR